MSLFLCLKTALGEPVLLELLAKFNIATATYLVQLSTAGPKQSEFTPVEFPLSDDVPKVLQAVPEFVAENIIDFMLFTRRFKDNMYEVSYTSLYLNLFYVGEELISVHCMCHLMIFLSANRKETYFKYSPIYKLGIA